MIFTWVQLAIATGENATDAAFSEMTSLPENVTHEKATDNNDQCSYQTANRNKS